MPPAPAPAPVVVAPTVADVPAHVAWPGVETRPRSRATAPAAPRTVRPREELAEPVRYVAPAAPVRTIAESGVVAPPPMGGENAPALLTPASDAVRNVGAETTTPKPASEPQWPTTGDAPLMLVPTAAGDLQPAGVSATAILTSPDRSFVSAVPVVALGGTGVALAVGPIAARPIGDQPVAGVVVVGPAATAAQRPVLGLATAASVMAATGTTIDAAAAAAASRRHEAPDTPQPAPDVPPAPAGAVGGGGGVFASAAGWAAGVGGALDATLVLSLIFGSLLVGRSLLAPAFVRSVAFVSLLERPG